MHSYMRAFKTNQKKKKNKDKTINSIAMQEMRKSARVNTNYRKLTVEQKGKLNACDWCNMLVYPALITRWLYTIRTLIQFYPYWVFHIRVLPFIPILFAFFAAHNYNYHHSCRLMYEYFCCLVYMAISWRSIVLHFAM